VAPLPCDPVTSPDTEARDETPLLAVCAGDELTAAVAWGAAVAWAAAVVRADVEVDGDGDGDGEVDVDVEAEADGLDVGVGLPQLVPVAVAVGLGLLLGLELAVAVAVLVAVGLLLALALPVPVWLPLPVAVLVDESDGVADGLADGVGGVVVGAGELGLGGVAEGDTEDEVHDGSGDALGCPVDVLGAAELLPLPNGWPAPFAEAAPTGPAELEPPEITPTEALMAARSGGTEARSTPTANTAQPIAIAGLSSTSRQSLACRGACRAGPRRPSPAPAGPAPGPEPEGAPPPRALKRRGMSARKPQVSHPERAIPACLLA
jgi:hypothetical protein